MDEPSVAAPLLLAGASWGCNAGSETNSPELCDASGIDPNRFVVIDWGESPECVLPTRALLHVDGVPSHTDCEAMGGEWSDDWVDWARTNPSIDPDRDVRVLRR